MKYFAQRLLFPALKMIYNFCRLSVACGLPIFKSEDFLVVTP